MFWLSLIGLRDLSLYVSISDTSYLNNKPQWYNLYDEGDCEKKGPIRALPSPLPSHDLTGEHPSGGTPHPADRSLSPISNKTCNRYKRGSKSTSHKWVQEKESRFF